MGVVGKVVRERVKARLDEAGNPLMTAMRAGLDRMAAAKGVPIEKAAVEPIMESIREEIAARPVATAAAGAEPWYQNRVKVGLYVVGFGAMAKLLSPELGGWFRDNAETLSTIIISFGAVIAAVGEWFAHYLAGIVWTRPWTIIGIGRNRTT